MATFTINKKNPMLAFVYHTWILWDRDLIVDFSVDDSFCEFGISTIVRIVGFSSPTIWGYV